MIYDISNTYSLRKPVRVFDAKGREWSHVLECDTETGRIFRYRTNNGVPIINETGTEIVRDEIFVDKPLQVIPLFVSENVFGS